MANRHNDRDRSYDRDMEQENNFPHRDRERFRSEGQQRYRNQEDSDWFEAAQNPSRQYAGGQENRGMGSDFERSGSGGQERFNREQNRGFGREPQYERGNQSWQEPTDASRWGRQFKQSNYGSSPYSEEYDRGLEDQRFGQRQSFGQGTNQFNQLWRGGQMDQQSFGQQATGRFSGRGPKGYRRSDERILEEINERLTQDPDLDASEIEVQVTNCEVTLQGTVENRQAKRRAEDLAESISGVHDVQNQIRVKSKNQESFGMNQETGQDFGKESSRNKSTSNKDK